MADKQGYSYSHSAQSSAGKQIHCQIFCIDKAKLNLMLYKLSLIVKLR